MAEADPLTLGHQGHKVKLNLVWVGVAGKSQSLRETHHVGVHSDGLSAKGVADNDVGRLSSHPREGQEIIKPLWHVAMEALDDFPAAILD